MPALLALLPELFDAILGFLAAGGWWQIPVAIGLWKVEQAVTEPPPPARQPQSPVQQVVGGAGAAAQGAGQAVGGVGKFMSDNAPLLILGGVALLVLRR